MKLQISVDGQTYEVEVEVAEDDYPQQMQDNRPTPTSATIQSTVLRTPSKPGSSLDPDNHEDKLCRSPLAGIVVQVPVAARTAVAGERSHGRTGSDEDGNRHHRADGGKAEIGQRGAWRIGEGKPGAGRIRLTSCSRSSPRRLRGRLDRKPNKEKDSQCC